MIINAFDLTNIGLSRALSINIKTIGRFDLFPK